MKEQIIIRILSLILFCILIFTTEVQASNWVPEWASSQKNVGVYDITDDIKNAISRSEVASLFNFSATDKCYLAIDSQKDENDLWTKDDYYYYNRYNGDDVFLPVRLYCTSGISYANFYYSHRDNESPAFYVFNESGGSIMIIIGIGKEMEYLKRPNTYEDDLDYTYYDNNQTEAIQKMFVTQNNYYVPGKRLEILNRIPGLLYVNLNNSGNREASNYRYYGDNYEEFFSNNSIEQDDSRSDFPEFLTGEHVCRYRVNMGNQSCDVSASLELFTNRLPFEKVTFNGCDLTERQGNGNNFIQITKINIDAQGVYDIEYECNTFYTNGNEWSDGYFGGAQSITIDSVNNSGDNSGNNRPGANAGKPSDKYEGLSTCTDLDVNKIKACGCIPAAIADIFSKIYFILRIVGPILLLILGGFEMAKAITTQDESAIEKAKRKLVNKFIAAAAIFLTLTVMKLVVSLLSKNAGDIIRCIDILLGGYEI